MPRKKGDKLSPELAAKAREVGKLGGRPRQEFLFQKRILKPNEKVHLNGTDLNLEEILFFIKIQATQEEIASHYLISPDTLDRRIREHLGMGFAEIKKIGAASGKLSMRILQYNQAKNNPTMSKHLGEIWLDQKTGSNDTNQKQNIIIKVQNEGLGSGLSVSAEAIPVASDSSSK